MPVIGFLNSGSAAEWAHLVAAFKEGLNEMGYVEGRNVAVEYRWAQGENDRLPGLAADLVGRQVAVIAAFGPPAALAAKAATSSIPIVFMAGTDPIDLGLVTNFRRPTANVTGLNVFAEVLSPKRQELLHESRPHRAAGCHVGQLYRGADPVRAARCTGRRRQARAAGARLLREQR
jgi:putative ABC transport system substrate-binding protein